MKEYLYLWIEKYMPLDDYGINNKDYLIENQGISLSSKYEIEDPSENAPFNFKIKKKGDVPDKFFSENIVDVKAIVGRNGSGKTTLLKRLFYTLISQGELVDSVNYVIIYRKENEFYYHHSGDLNISFNESEIVPHLCENSDDCKAEYPIFYTAAFNNVEPLKEVQNRGDLSTNALLSLDDKSLYSISPKYRSIANLQKNYHGSHITMELIRKVAFASHFYEDVDKASYLQFRLPNAIIIAPSYVDIENAIIEITEGSQSEIKKWQNLQNEIVSKDKYSFKNLYRFAALLNRIRADLSNANMKDFMRKSFDEFLHPENIKDIKKALKSYTEKKISIVLDGKKTLINYAEDNLYDEVENNLTLIEKLSDFQNLIHEKYPNYNKDSFFFDLRNESHRIVLEKFVDAYVKTMRLTPFLYMNWRPQSSGEEKFIEFYSRLYYNLSDYKRPVRNNENPSELHIVVDEADLYLHPDWQRNWLFEFMNILEIILTKLYSNNRPQVHLFFSTHSPFIITDLSRDNITLLDLKENMKTKVVNNHKISPFGANLYDLLSEGFFLKNSIGALSEKYIEDLVRYRRGKYEFKPDENRDDVKDRMDFVLKSIGDPIVGSLINEMNNESESTRAE